MRKRLVSACLLGILIAASVTHGSRAQGASSELRCRIKGGFGLFVSSQRPMTCTYYRPDGGVEFYTGDAGRLGIDVGITNAVILAYTVHVADPSIPAALDGTFAGPGGGITLGTGVGADALVGGRTGSATLVPLGNTNLTGLDVNAGLGILNLHYAGQETAYQRRR